jgi:hypothetical protein
MCFATFENLRAALIILASVTAFLYLNEVNMDITIESNMICDCDISTTSRTISNEDIVSRCECSPPARQWAAHLPSARNAGSIISRLLPGSSVESNAVALHWLDYLRISSDNA